MPIWPWPLCPLAGQARWGQNVVAGSMRILLSWRCWGACQEGVCLGPNFGYKCFSPRLAVELPTTKLACFLMKFRSMGPLSSPLYRSKTSMLASHHPMIRKQFASLLITPRVSQLGILGGVLNILVSDPVLHKLELSPCVEQMRGDGVLETVELPLLRREARLLAIGLHGTPERAPINGYAAVGDKQIW